ncbi:MAG: GNAT family N-acetyltransferase [Ardenticatenaceae bacterium]|nr:GNAT family N-acetyltransferase [Ardenticatenaceae bacterium]MCB9446480.1 GNAT family N-acetyltransferase [Ardenticatenaceae bacterium]
MIAIKLLEKLDRNELKQVITGYTSPGKYVITYSDSPTQTSFNLTFQMLDKPRVGHYDHLDDETLARYRDALPHGFSFGAFDQDSLAGVLLAEPQAWNKSLWVWEFHVGEAMRGRGIGRQLMETAVQKAREAGLRTIVCETQNTNATAVNVYRRLGFAVEAIDISYYSNDDYPDGDVAVFMKRRL